MTQNNMGTPERPIGNFESKWKGLIDALGEWFGGTEVVIYTCPDPDACTASLWPLFRREDWMGLVDEIDKNEGRAQDV